MKYYLDKEFFYGIKFLVLNKKSRRKLNLWDKNGIIFIYCKQ